MGPETELLRQIHPAFVQAGRVTSQAFRPTPKDQMKLSVYDGDQITPSASWEHFTSQGFESCGVLAVNVAECETLQLPVKPDPEPFPEHVVIRFDGLSNNQIEKASKKLRDFAWRRNWRWRP